MYLLLPKQVKDSSEIRSKCFTCNLVWIQVYRQITRLPNNKNTAAAISHLLSQSVSLYPVGRQTSRKEGLGRDTRHLITSVTANRKAWQVTCRV